MHHNDISARKCGIFVICGVLRCTLWELAPCACLGKRGSSVEKYSRLASDVSSLLKLVIFRRRFTVNSYQLFTPRYRFGCTMMRFLFVSAGIFCFKRCSLVHPLGARSLRLPCKRGSSVEKYSRLASVVSSLLKLVIFRRRFTVNSYQLFPPRYRFGCTIMRFPFVCAGIFCFIFTPWSSAIPDASGSV